MLAAMGVEIASARTRLLFRIRRWHTFASFMVESVFEVFISGSAKGLCSTMDFIGALLHGFRRHLGCRDYSCCSGWKTPGRYNSARSSRC
jgi:hypothetical protein